MLIQNTNICPLHWSYKTNLYLLLQMQCSLYKLAYALIRIVSVSWSHSIIPITKHLRHPLPLAPFFSLLSFLQTLGLATQKSTKWTRSHLNTMLLFSGLVWSLDPAFEVGIYHGLKLILHFRSDGMRSFRVYAFRDTKWWAVLTKARVLSVKGKKVLHIDRNDHYGG